MVAAALALPRRGLVLPDLARFAMVGVRRALLSRAPIVAVAGGGGASSAYGVSGLTLWYKADSESYANNDPVPTATDQSVTAANATSTGSNRPTFITGAQNSKAVFRFATGQFLRTVALTNVAQPTTIVVACKKRLNDSIEQRFVDGGGGSHRQIIGGHTGSNQAAYYAGSFQVGSATITDFNIYMAVFNGASSSFYLNGTTVLSSANPGADSFDGMTIGASPSGSTTLDGDVGEVLVFAGVALSAPNRALVFSGVGTRWGITIT
jgi:hypothetical protein